MVEGSNELLWNYAVILFQYWDYLVPYSRKKIHSKKKIILHDQTFFMLAKLQCIILLAKEEKSLWFPQPSFPFPKFNFPFFKLWDKITKWNLTRNLFGNRSCSANCILRKWQLYHIYKDGAADQKMCVLNLMFFLPIHDFMY